jgi:hypothetical protein
MASVESWNHGDPPLGFAAYAQKLFELDCPPAVVRNFLDELIEMTLAHCGHDILLAWLATVNAFIKA